MNKLFLKKRYQLKKNYRLTSFSNKFKLALNLKTHLKNLIF